MQVGSLQAQAEHQAEKARRASEERAQAAAIRHARYEQQKAERNERLRRESEWRSQRAAMARSRAADMFSERLRMRDPIHVYALKPGRDGASAASWELILDYHKGAHALDLYAPSQSTPKSQRLLITEDKSVFEFELHIPADFSQIGKLPLLPGRLCDGF